MKLVKEILYENQKMMNFTEYDTDPVKDMDIGVKRSIEKWLDNLDIIDYKLTRKYTINVYNSVFIPDENLNEFPIYIKFNHIMGGFHINNNNFNSLRGCPHSVSGSFLVSNNNLRNLKNGPFVVKESYGASHNQLETLEGIAEIIENSIYINNNNLKNLKYLPFIVKGDLNISKNPINTLEYFPKEIEGNLQFTPSTILSKEIIFKKCKVWGHVTEIR